jgi:2-haloacid dehalogenase
VLFDVVETLFSLSPIEDALEPTGVGADLFFTRLLRDGFALTAAGDFRPFGDVARAALTAQAPTTADEVINDVVAAFGRLPAHSDVRPALEGLASAGVTIATLTNGSRDTTSMLLDNAGLTTLVQRVLTVEDAGAWKPSPRPYRRAAAVLGREPGDVALVAVHAWDVHGAHRAGFTTGWCSRLEGHFTELFEPPDVTGNDLIAVVEGLLELPA